MGIYPMIKHMILSMIFIVTDGVCYDQDVENLFVAVSYVSNYFLTICTCTCNIIIKECET